MFGLGKERLDPAEVASGLMGVVMLAHRDRQEWANKWAQKRALFLKVLEAKGPHDVARVDEELRLLRTFAALYAIRLHDSRRLIEEAFWLFAAENGDDVKLSKAALDDYEHVAFAWGGGAQGEAQVDKQFLWELGKVFAKRLRSGNPLIGAAGFADFVEVFKVATAFVDSVRITLKQRERSVVADLLRKHPELERP